MARSFQLAQINLARLRFPFESPQARQFVAAVEKINRLAEQSPGFIWRYDSGDRHGSAPDVIDDPLLIVNLSVWQSYEHLHAYVYRSTHGHYVRRRYEWFEPIPTPATALWWVPAGHRPQPSEALARLHYLRTHGPTPQAFTVRSRFAPDGRREPRTRRSHQARKHRDPHA